MEKSGNILIEQGEIVKILKGQKAKVRVKRHSRCIGCSQKSFCDPFGSEVMHITVRNPIQAKVGQQVEVRLTLTSPKRSLLILYIFPLSCLILGAAIGNALALFHNPDLSAALGSSVFLILSFLVIHLYARRQSKQDKLPLPTITRILDKNSQV